MCLHYVLSIGHVVTADVLLAKVNAWENPHRQLSFFVYSELCAGMLLLYYIRMMTLAHACMGDVVTILRNIMGQERVDRCSLRLPVVDG